MAKYERIADYLNTEKFPDYSSAKQGFVRAGTYNKGVQKALDEFYNQIQFKRSKVRILRTKKGQVVVKDKSGHFISKKGYAKWIKTLLERK